ncbi:MAG: Spy/CpxP family protein refolding chaperone [Mariprofundus sp.]
MNNRITGQAVSNRGSLLIFAIAAMLAVGAANVAYACPPGDGIRHLQRMADDLKLTEVQRQQFKQIHRESRDSEMTLHDAMQDNRDAQHQLNPGDRNYRSKLVELADEKAALVKQMVIHHGELRANVYAMLTPEQRQRAKELAAERPHHQKGERGQHRGPDRGRF